MNQPELSGKRARAILAMYVSVTFLAATLVFLVQPMATRLLLPQFGGSAAVWNTALVVFQTLLLAGYAAAHLMTHFPAAVRRAVQVIIVTAPLVALPFALPSSIDSTSPTVSVLVTLTVMIGAPYFALTTMSPTMQRWFGETGHSLAANPYPLYAAGNAGSLLALLAYPVVFEPLMDVRTQTIVFTAAYAVMAGLLVVAAVSSRSQSRRAAPVPFVASAHTENPLRTWEIIFLSFVPSFLLLGVTRHLTTDVASLPLLWVIPLVIYLGSFVVSFQGTSPAPAKLASRTLRLLLIPAILLSGRVTFFFALTFGIPLVVFASTAYLAHRQLYDRRPPVSGLTRFYMLLSVGGALGGVAGALVAPVVFNRIIEYPLGLVLAATVLLDRPEHRARVLKFVTVGAVAAVVALGALSTNQVLGLALIGLGGLIVYALSWRKAVYTLGVALMALAVFAPANEDRILAAERTFYGTYEVRDVGGAHVIVSGSTNHGVQRWVDGRPQPGPVAYYHPVGPIGSTFEELAADTVDVGIIGLGAGALVEYLGLDDRVTYYEIDPLVQELAENPEYFTFLRDTQAEVDIVIGDGRLELERLEPAHDVLAVDAFTSDAIPIHLLTKEAVETYLDSVVEDGVLIFHISNRHFDLVPVVGRLTDEAGLHARVARFTPTPDIEFGQSVVVVIASQSEDRVDDLADEDYWAPIVDDGPLWTDDFSNIIRVIEWS